MGGGRPLRFADLCVLAKERSFFCLTNHEFSGCRRAIEFIDEGNYFVVFSADELTSPDNPVARLRLPIESRLPACFVVFFSLKFSRNSRVFVGPFFATQLLRITRTDSQVDISAKSETCQRN